eukprot:4848509-Prorocentrum_lima.AAC.1
MSTDARRNLPLFHCLLRVALASAMVLTDYTQYHLRNTVYWGIGLETLLSSAVTCLSLIHISEPTRLDVI